MLCLWELTTRPLPTEHADDCSQMHDDLLHAHSHNCPSWCRRSSMCVSGLRNWDGSCGSLLWPSQVPAHMLYACMEHAYDLGQVFACHAARQKPRNTRPTPPPRLLHTNLTLAAGPACNFQQHRTSAGHSGFETRHLTTGLMKEGLLVPRAEKLLLWILPAPLQSSCSTGKSSVS